MDLDFIPIAEDSEYDEDDKVLQDSNVSETSDLDSNDGPFPAYQNIIEATYYCCVTAYQNCKICHSQKTIGCILPCCQYKKFICFECLSSLFISEATDTHQIPKFFIQTCINSLQGLISVNCPFCRSKIKTALSGDIQKYFNQITIVKISVPK
jgi:hypothetical protein